MALGNSGAASLLVTVAIAMLLISAIGQTSLVLTGVTRLPMAAGWDHLAPRWFLRQHPKWGAIRAKLPRWLPWVSGLEFLATLFSVALLAYPFVDVVSPGKYAAKILGTVLVSNLIALCLYFMRGGQNATAE